MRIDILTLFPVMCESVLGESIIGRARRENLVEINCHNIRDYADDKHRRVDDYPFGGGQGMIMRAEPIAKCFEAVCANAGSRPHLIVMSPKGAVFDQQKAKELLQYENLCILCGHYEGIDQRVIDEIADEEISAGDFVLTGGELPALMIADAVARMLPGVLAAEQSFEQESHFSGLLEHPQYTRPAVWRGKKVPDVLLSGNHSQVEKWQREKAREETERLRPDLVGKKSQKCQ
ncbi:MAG: tRNA (guanosine(37)-N1)-methyltransferase TrmD [Clostridia bacterium]|nr:tRNA (guanosine(37)-N1)-methyltransferase TrmD [Clostridia bacterium]